MEFTNALNKYIPSLVLSQWMSKLDSTAGNVLPELQSTETVVLFADISGFTMISEACAVLGVRGNEELAFCINRYMEGMVKSLGKYGGDIIKFVGDAMIVMWPRFGGSDTTAPLNKEGKSVAFKDQMDDRVTVVRKAIQCAIDIQNELSNKKIMSNVTNLSVKIGIGYGECALLYVGGVFNRSEFFTVGGALTQALKSEENATAGGQIIVSQNAYQLVTDFFTSDEIINESGGRFYKISGMKQGIRTRADAVLLRNLIQADNYAKIQNKLRSCIPAAIMPYLEIGYEQFGSECRRLTIMFASLGVDLSSAQTEAGMQKIQKIVTTVQQQVYRLEGSLNKLVMDDKGSTLICIWGLCPFAHEDDAARAILTAINMKKELNKIDNTWCNIGISTGEVFSGVVGTSGSRKEFSVLGDYVNLAARVMYYPKKYKQVNKINVDMQTKKEADNFISFVYKGHCEFKGKSISLPIFEPIEPEEEAAQCLNKIVPFDTFLKIHSNPFIIDRDSDHKKKYCKQIGRENLLHKVCDDLYDFFDPDNKGNQRPYLLAVQGEIGSGKTLFARNLFDQLKKRKDFLRDDILGSDFKALLTSSINAESQMKFLSSWRPILQMMLNILSRKNKMKPEQVLKQLMLTISDERYDIIMDIFNMSSQSTFKLQQQLRKDPLHFVKREKYTEDVVDGVLDFLIEFIKEVLGEKDDYYSDQEQSQLNSDNGSRVSSLRPKIIQSETPLVAIFDSVFYMDEASWKLIELIKDECQQIAIILLVQTDTNNQAKIHPEARTFYQETFGNHLDLLQIIDLPPFKVEELSQLVTELGPKYKQSMTDEIMAMLFIEDPATSIKSPEVCKVKEKELKKKHLLNENFIIINDEVLQITLQRCEGNPFVCLHFLFHLIINDFLMIKDSCLQPTSIFKKCQQRKDWSHVPVPGINQKINNNLLDNFLKEMRSKQNKVDSENAVKGILLLKCASIVGEVFTSKVIQHINPLRNDTYKQIIAILKILESKDFIEILDETDPKNIICRFRKCFLRETIYQQMLYRAQKKGLHQLMVQFIQNNPNQFDNDPEEEAEKMLNHILVSEDLESEDKIPFKAKQGLVVKKIANKVMRYPESIIKSGMLTKQGEKPNKKTEKRLMIIKAKEIQWFHDEKELKNNKPLGVIYMTSVYHCVPANTAKSTQDFIIGASAWRKKLAEKEGRREFIFGAKDETERDEWISCIEYLRTKAVYDNFTQKFCNISFPLRRGSEDKQIDQRDGYLSLVNEFGMKLKQSTRMVKGALAIQDDPNNSMLNKSVTRNSARNSRITSTKVGSFANYNLAQVQENSQMTSFNNPKDIANKLKKLYSCSIISFVNQVSQNSNKQSQRFDSIKRLPDVLKNSNMLIQEDNSIDYGNQSLIMKTQPSANTQDEIQNNYTAHNSSSLYEDAIKLKEIRRLSAIARREIFEDKQELKQYLESLKTGNFSPITKGQTNTAEVKITEEDENSDSSLEMGSLPRKSHISDNTAKSAATPNQGGIMQKDYYTSNNSEISVAQNNSQRIERFVQNERSTKTQKDSPITQQELKNQGTEKKSRISKQLDMISGLQKNREYTFHKQQQDTEEEEENKSNNETNSDNGQQMFALNLKQTQKGTSPNKVNRKTHDPADEKYKSKNSLNQATKTLKQDKRKQSSAQEIFLERSQSFSSSDQSEEQEKQQDLHQLTNRDTGKFSQIENQTQDSKTSQSHSKQHSKQSSQQFANNQNLQKEKDKSKNKQNQQKSVQQTSQNSKESPIKQTSQDTLNTSVKIQQNNEHVTSNMDYIANTIKDEVAKGIQQFIQSVQQQVMPQQQVYQSPISSQKQQNMAYNKTIDSTSSKKSQNLNNSSLYDEEWRNSIQTRAQASGGATSSKKVSMIQAQSKSGQNNQTSGFRNSKQQQLQDSRYSERGIGEREETEVDDEDEETVADPEVQYQQRNNQKNKSMIVNKKQQRNDNSQNRIEANRQQQVLQQNRIPILDSNYNQNQKRSTSPFMRQSDLIVNQNHSHLSYSPSPMQHLQGGDYSPLNSYTQQLPYMTPPYQSMYIPNHQQQQFMSQFAPYDQALYQQPQYPPYMNQYSLRPDTDLMLMEDQLLDNTITHPQQFLADMSSIIHENTVDNLVQLGIVLEDCQCQLKGDLMSLYEGDQVEIIRTINDIGMIECRYQGQVGIFHKHLIKVIKRASAASVHLQNTISIQNSIRQQNSENSPVYNQQKNVIKSGQGIQTNEQKQNGYQQNSNNSFNDALTSQSYQRQQQQQQQNPQQNQRQNFFLPKQQQNATGNNLKLNERKKQRQMRTEDESAERLIDQLNL